MKLAFRMAGVMLLLLLVGYALIRMSYLSSRKDCYGQLMEVFNQRGTVIRHAHMSDQEICASDRTLILKGIDCFRQLEPVDPFFGGEPSFLDMLSKNIARATKTEIETVNDFNTSCPYRDTKIEFDLNLPDPYIANF